MRDRSRITASAVVGSLVLLCASVATAQTSVRPIANVASLGSGSIAGVVEDERGAPVTGAIVSAFGATPRHATTDHGGRFELSRLSPGRYYVRAHSTGFVASNGKVIEVRPSSQSSSLIALRHVTSEPVLAAGTAYAASPASLAEPVVPPPSRDVASGGNDDHGETAWRLRHARRGILKDAVVPDAIIADGDPTSSVFGPASFLERAVGSPARLATSFFTGTPFSGQVNLLTTGSFDTPQQFFTADSFSNGVAYMAVTAPAGGSADWTVRGALTQGDIASWIVAGSYTSRATARHRSDIGLSYATQRYEGGNPAALRGVTDGSRNAGAMYGFDTFAITPAISLTYGGRYAHYDYLANRGLISPRVAVTLIPADHYRLNALVSSRAVAPGAEEFLPPGDSGIWLPPQRTFSSLGSSGTLHAERTTHAEVELERDFVAGSTLSFRAYRQHTEDQLVTMFGVDMPGGPPSEIGHYFIGNSGDVDAAGWSVGLRTAVMQRMHASLQYSLARAGWNPGPDLAYMVLLAPSAVRLQSERIQGLSTAVEAEVPETSTRVLVLYRLSNGFARSSAASGQGRGADRPTLDSRFDIQVRQSLPFMNFSNARWEMLLAVHNFFRDAAADQSLYDELLVVRPPKRVVGGLTLRF